MNFSGKNVLVTGGAGFIGSNLVIGLLKENASITVYDNFSFGHISNLDSVKDQIKIVEGDILDFKKLADTLRENDVEYVFHLVADPYVPNSYESPDKVFKIITQGTMNVLLGCMETEIKRILNCSSAEIYGNYEYLPINEEHPTKPLSIYAIAKLAADRFCLIMHKEKNIPVLNLRLFNTYGFRETHPYIIPELISQLSKSKNVELGNIQSRRSFIFIEDAVRGFIELMRCNKAIGESVNLGSDKSYSVKELADIIGEIMDYSSVNITIKKNRIRPLDPKVLECDYTKVNKLVDWKPKINLKVGLKRTIEWFEENDGKWL